MLGGIVPSHNRFNQCNCSLVRAVGMWTCGNEPTCSRIFLTASSCCNCSRTGLLDSLSVSISVIVTFTGCRAGSGFNVLLILREKIVRSNQSFPCRLHGNSSSMWLVHLELSPSPRQLQSRLRQSVCVPTGLCCGWWLETGIA